MQLVFFEAGPGWLAAAFTGDGLWALTLPSPSPEIAVTGLAAETGLAGEWDKHRKNAVVLRSGDPVPAGGEAGCAPGAALVLVSELRRYFAGEEAAFSVAIDWTGYTPFQRRVLEVVRSIPAGRTMSYGEVALLAGSPRGARAVGGVMKANRTPLVIPCHRVITASGDTGCFGGGREMKKFLLDLEKRGVGNNGS